MSHVRVARVALSLALLFTVLFMFTLPFPPGTSHERTTWMIFGTLFVLEAVAMLLLTSGHVLPRVILYVLGAFGLVAAVSHTVMLVHGEHAPPDTPTRSAVFVIVMSTALFVAAVLTMIDRRKTL